KQKGIKTWVAGIMMNIKITAKFKWGNIEYLQVLFLHREFLKAERAGETWLKKPITILVLNAIIGMEKGLHMMMTQEVNVSENILIPGNLIKTIPCSLPAEAVMAFCLSYKKMIIKDGQKAYVRQDMQQIRNIPKN